MKKTLAFTMADRRSSRTRTFGYSLAFTMAEILISLTIIGIIAAITLPSLMANVTEKAWDAQRKALRTRLAQALGTIDDINSYSDNTVNGKTEYRAVKFVTEGLGSALDIKNVCEQVDLESEEKGFFECNIPASGLLMSGGGQAVMLAPVIGPGAVEIIGENFVGEHNMVAFQTANGESIIAMVANSCQSDPRLLSQSACINFIYDLNGKKGPNAFGKDLGFMTAFYSDKLNLVAPMPVYIATSWSFSQNSAKSTAADLDNARLPNTEELASILINTIFINRDAYHGLANGYLWSNVSASSSTGYIVGFSDTGFERMEQTKSENYGMIAISNDGSAPKKIRTGVMSEPEEEDEGAQ